MDERYDSDEKESRNSHTAFWMTALAFLIVIGAAATSMYYIYQQKDTISQLTGQTSGMNATIGQLQSQLDTTTAKLNDVSAAQATTANAAANAAKSGTPATSTAASRAEANRVKQLQSRLDDQQKQLQSTQDDIANARTDLQGNLDSTRDQLTGSIAKTHDELVLLEKRGERDYVEFDLTKSKDFKREGPVSLMLRRADSKHANMDLAVLVNDRQINKKRVNLYEPVWIQTDNGQPLQVVVNKIDAKSVHGYVNAPKYSASDLAASSSPVALPAPIPAPVIAAPRPETAIPNIDSADTIDKPLE